MFLIEDAAEALGSTFQNTQVGSFGDAAMFSFCGNKVITTGEGGIVVTNNPKLDRELRLLRSHGRMDRGTYFSSAGSFDHLVLGHNWRISDLTAELGRSQFSKLHLLTEKRRTAAKMYDNLLEGLPLTESLFKSLDTSNLS